MIDTIIFDIGRVLVDVDNLAGIRKMGFTEEMAVYLNDTLFPEFWVAFDRYNIGKEETIRAFKEKMPGYEKEIDSFWEQEAFLTTVRPFASPWLKELKERGFGVYILSNYGRLSYEINSQDYDFLAYADGAVISYEVEHMKPEPEIYEALIEKYGLVPSHCVFIDDRQENVDGAIRCGMQGILYETFEQTKEELERRIRL